VDVLFLFLLVVVAFVLLVVLPSRARNKQVQSLQHMQRSLEIGTEVMTSSGVFGRVVRVGADDIDLEIAPGVVTTWMLLAIREIKSPTRAPAEPVDDADPEVLDGEPFLDDEPVLDDEAELDAADRADLDALPETEPEAPPTKGRRKRPGAGG
jgi:preprotein translocase subunit YajC